MNRFTRRTKIAVGCILFLALAGSGCTGRKSRRTIIVGFDGLTSDIMAPMMEEGLLPHFSRISMSGASGDLESSIPRLSPTAWTTAATGVNPGKHGIFSYCKGLVPTAENEVLLSYYSAVDRGVSPLWVLLSDSGLRSVVINVPSTSPPDSINGVMVAGGPYTSTTEFTFPREIGEKFPADYTLSRGVEDEGKAGEQHYLERLKTVFAARKQGALELMDTEDWDFFFVVFTLPDRVERYYWQYTDEKHPLYTAEGASLYGSMIAEIYGELDSALGEFDTRAESMGANIIAFSASGHQPVYWDINGANLLNEHWPMEGRDIYIGQTDRHGGTFSIWFPQPPEVNRENWEKYSSQSSELMQVLADLQNPETGEKVIDVVHQRGDIYSGPRSNGAPDVIAVEKRGYLFVNRNFTEDGKIFYRPTAGTFSSHPGKSGVLYARGPDIASGVKLNDADIMDVTPTVLYLLGVSIPSYMDGRVLEEMISREYSSKHPVDEMIRELPMDTGKKAAVLTAEEENRLRNQLDSVE